MATEPRSGLHVVQVRYFHGEPWPAATDPVPAYAASGVYNLLGDPTIITPEFADTRRSAELTETIGLIGGEIAAAVAAGREAGNPVLIIGGACDVLPGVIGGLQEVHGPIARIGLVWFDAHGDFNTPRTTLTGMLGGMPVAVAAGLAYPRWRELSHQPAPLPTDRIVMVDVRNLDPAEEQLIRATEVVIAAAAPGFPGAGLEESVRDLAARCDLIYLHVDSDVLDARYVPNHFTPEPNGPNIEQIRAAIDTVMATGKVAAFGVVAVWAGGKGGDVAVASALELLRGGLESWQQHGLPEDSVPRPA